MVVLKSVEENLEQLPSIAAIHQKRGINDTAVLQKDRARHGKIASRLKGTRKLVEHLADHLDVAIAMIIAVRLILILQLTNLLILPGATNIEENVKRENTFLIVVQVRREVPIVIM